jgi:SP family general alpha glucoside:H+ symporter-like MFS transporter
MFLCGPHLISEGLPNNISFKMSICGLGIASIGTVASWILMSYCVRRTIYLWGLGGLTAILIGVGAISAGDARSSQGKYAQAGLVIGWLAIYYLTVGSMCYAIITEVSSTRLRSKSVCLSHIAHYIANIICNVITAYMLIPTAGNWKSKTGFLWGACALVFFIWTFLRLSKTKGRSFEEIDILFAKGIDARDFRKHHVNAPVEAAIGKRISTEQAQILLRSRTQIALLVCYNVSSIISARPC